MLIEKLFTHKGYVCIVCFNCLAHRTGYVVIPRGHSIRSKIRDVDEVVSVYGGITYNGTLDSMLGGSEGKYLEILEPLRYNALIGFDCGHYGDGTDVDSYLKCLANSGYSDKEIEVMSMEAKAFHQFNLGSETIRDIQFVEEQLMRMANQLHEYQIAHEFDGHCTKI
jgi:hypothetical protein